MPLNRNSRRRTAGLSVIETSVSLVLVVAGLGVAGRTAMRIQSARQEVAATDSVDRRLDGAMDRVLESLDNVASASIANDLSLPGGSSTITFKDKTGWSGSTSVLGVATTIAWESDPADPVNGVDDDKDGVVDQGDVVLTRDVGGKLSKSVLVTGVTRYLQGETANSKDDNGNGLVDEGGLCFTRAGDKLTVLLTVARRSAGKAMVTRTLSGAVRVQN